MSTLAYRDEVDLMLHNKTFHQGLLRNKKESLIRKYHNHILQTNAWHRESNRQSKKYNLIWKLLSGSPRIYTIDHPSQVYCIKPEG